MIREILDDHHAGILRMNAEFVHWLSPLDQTGLRNLLNRAEYARQIGDGKGVLIGYAHDVDDPAHKNLRWLKARIGNFFYIDRVIIDSAAQGQGWGLKLYADIEAYARKKGYDWLACEVNTRPDNPGSHKFHMRLGFRTLGDETYPDIDKALRYYAKALN